MDEPKPTPELPRRFRKNAARGAVLRYPPGVSNMGTDENPQLMDNEGIAGSIADYHETNSKIILENPLPACEINYADDSKGDLAFESLSPEQQAIIKAKFARSPDDCEPPLIVEK
jgi:hypothetical protein